MFWDRVSFYNCECIGTDYAICGGTDIVKILLSQPLLSWGYSVTNLGFPGRKINGLVTVKPVTLY